MKKTKILISVSVLLAVLLAVCSCKNGSDGETSDALYYTVTFNSAGGSATEAVKILEGGKISAPTEPIREGYIFDGWQNDGKEWNFDTAVKSDITLTAKWIDAATVFKYYAVEGAEGQAVISAMVYDFSDVIRVPSVIKGLTVVGIGDGVFEGKDSDSITEIIVPETVTSVGKNAFKDCGGIEIELNGALTSVGESAFFGCDGLTSVTFGEGLTEISAQSFGGCTGLTELKLPSTLEKIGENAFEDCSAIVYIVMHDGVKLANSAFIACDAVKTVYFYGDEEGFEAIFADKHGNSEISEAKLYLYSAEKPEENGNYWYIDGKGKIKLWK